jgi:hypothetical protein
MVNISTNFVKTYNYLSPQIIEKKTTSYTDWNPDYSGLGQVSIPHCQSRHRGLFLIDKQNIDNLDKWIWKLAHFILFLFTCPKPE